VTKNISLSIATASKGRAAIAASIAVSFYTRFRLPEPSQITVAMGYGRLAGIDAPVNVDRGKFHFGFANPSGVARMAYRERPRKRWFARHWRVSFRDRLVFAVRADTGINSIEELKAKRFPLRVSTRMTGSLLSTLFIIDEVLKGYGFSLSDIKSWGGKIMRVSNPSSPERGHHLRSSEADAVRRGLEQLGRFSPQPVCVFCRSARTSSKRLERLGFPSAGNEQRIFRQELIAVDFSGSPLLCRSDLAPEFAVTGFRDRFVSRADSDHFDRRP
jgi:hypothetical protein